MHYVHDVYKVINRMTGETVFRGSVREIAEKYFLTTGTVYKVAQGKSKTLLGKYILEYDGEEAWVK